MEKSSGKSFVYGTHYWRPPNPPREEHRYHLEKIKCKLNFDIVKFRIQWNWHNRGPECYFFDEVHELFDICDELDLGVLLELNLETAPYWLENEYPATRYVNANGRSIELGSQEATPGGGHPGLCFHNDMVMHHAEKFIRQMVREFRGRKSLKIYDCWNEPHLEPAWCNNMWGNMGDRVYCYCQASRQAFRDWLKKRYVDIEVFNSTWGRAYNNFEQINPPILQGNYADWLDWMRFWFDQLQANMAWRVKIIKQEDTGRQVMSHSGAVPPVHPRANACIHNWKFANEVDMWGTSFAPQAFSWDLATCAQVIELTRSAARGKDFWISEMPGGSSNIRGFKSSRLPQPKDYHVWNWLAVILGSHGTVHWCYLTERTGHETGNYGMMRLDGRDTKRSKAIAETVTVLKKYQDIITTADTQTQVAVLYDPDNSSVLFAMELDDTLYGKSHTGYYRAIWQSDLSARYVTYETLKDVTEKVLIVPMALTMPDHVADWLAEFVFNGGVVIAEARTGLLDHRGFLRHKLPAGKLSDAAGLTEGESVASDISNKNIAVPTADGTLESCDRCNVFPMDPIHLGPSISFTAPIETKVTVQYFLTPLELEGAEPIGCFEDMVLAAKHDYGKGVMYYFGTYMGLALDKNIPEAHKIVKTILHDHVSPKVRGVELRPRIIDNDKEAILAVFSEQNDKTISEVLEVPEIYKYATDVMTDETIDIKSGRLQVTVPAREVSVFLLNRSNEHGAQE